MRSRFITDVGGIAAVELSLVILPLFVLMMVIAEASLFVFAQQQFDLSVQRAARLLRTGTFQEEATGADPAQSLRGLLCGTGIRLYQCDEMRVDLVRTATFAIKQITPAYDVARGDWAAGFGTQFTCPSGGGIHVLRAAVPILRPFSFLDFTGQRMPGGKQLLTATAVFRTEDYADKPCA
ncbi:TadE/TadG family type IV pilus assembly protein [Methylorubrum extorquens]|uniref:TadE/TadG family type IV pilus assembly protein n=1 Tax=Methylorubrum extorquens TaxID=408 RepID=UPI0018C88647